jgi:hypothetical protein
MKRLSHKEHTDLVESLTDFVSDLSTSGAVSARPRANARRASCVYLARTADVDLDSKVGLQMTWTSSTGCARVTRVSISSICFPRRCANVVQTD